MTAPLPDRLRTRLTQLLRANAILMWAALVGFVGALATLLFRDGLTLLQALLFGRSGSSVDIATALPWQARLLTPCAGGLLAGCRRTQSYRTTVELTRVHAFGRDPKAPGMMDVELRYADCPGDARRLVRGDKTFAACGLNLKAGMRVPAEVVRRYDPDRGQFRSEVTRIGDCAITTDPKDEANYEMVEDCTDLKASGAVVGVHCSRRRDTKLITTCPWLLRN